jgi:hypothetical protein
MKWIAELAARTVESPHNRTRFEQRLARVRKALETEAALIYCDKQRENRNGLKSPLILCASTLWGVHPIHFSALQSYNSRSVG